MILNKGWTDIYSWSLSGNYVEFGTNGDGDYVVRLTADAADKIEETNERDNTSYTWVRVEGNEVTILERGWGTDPWDPQKEIAEDSFLRLDAASDF